MHLATTNKSCCRVTPAMCPSPHTLSTGLRQILHSPPIRTKHGMMQLYTGYNCPTPMVAEMFSAQRGVTWLFDSTVQWPSLTSKMLHSHGFTNATTASSCQNRRAGGEEGEVPSPSTLPNMARNSSCFCFTFSHGQTARSGS